MIGSIKSSFRIPGFTAIELMLSVAILAAIAGFAVAGFFGFQARNDLNMTTDLVVQNLRQAQIYARTSREGGAWGVALDADEMTLFQGDSYASRNSAFDEVYPLPVMLTVSGLSEVVFSRVYGIPYPTGTIDLVSEVNGEQHRVVVNDRGMVEIQ